MTASPLPTDRQALKSELECGLTFLKINVNQLVIKQLLDYLALLEKWNKVQNLTAIRDQHQMVSTHLLDSLTVLPHLPEGPLLDVGTGAGLPGIPLAMVRQDLAVTLLDNSQKRVAFLRQAIADFHLSNVQAVCHKVETWFPQMRFNCIISRAYAEIARFIESSQHLLAEDGVFAAMKGRYPDDEIKAIPPGFGVRTTIELAVPGLEAERHLILIGRA